MMNDLSTRVHHERKTELTLLIEGQISKYRAEMFVNADDAFQIQIEFERFAH